MEQEDGLDDARLTFVTHLAREGDVRSTLAALEQLGSVGRIAGVMRIVEDGGS
jgi:hypothetical protein